MNYQPKRLRQISIFESLENFKRQKTSILGNMNENEKIRFKTLSAAEQRLSSSIVKPEIPLAVYPNIKGISESIPSTSHSEKKTELDESANFSEKQTTCSKSELSLLASCSINETTADSDSESSFQNSADLFPQETSSQEDYSSGYSTELLPNNNCTESQSSSQSDDADEDDEDELMFLNRRPMCCFPLPKLEPLENHTIMFSPYIRPGDPPRPYPPTYRDEWSTTYVRMPCSPRNKYPVEHKDGETIIESRWKLIYRSLRREIKSSEDLEQAIMKYNSQYIGRWSFRGLHFFLNVCLSQTEREHFFDEILPSMIEMALDLPNICTQPVRLLKKGRDHKVTISQKQIGCLLLNAFFCTFPRRNLPKNKKLKWSEGSEYATFPDINFNRLFFSNKNEITKRNMGKLKCLLNYFRRITTEVPTGTVTFHRQSLQSTDLPKWHESSRGFKSAVVRSSGFIETLGQGMLQVDFANKYVGGGVLSQGCVQEEIRFVICPELIVSRLFVECLDFNEVLIVTGVEQYNKYSGYADTFKWEGNFRDVTPRDSWGRRYTQLVAMDATHFRDTKIQFEPACIKKELNKAYCGFYEDCPPANLSAIATGNWGCGAFNGNCNLKFLIQLMAASEAGRSLLYITFGNKKLKSELQNMYDFLNGQNLVVGDVWRLLVQYAENLHRSNQKENFNLYSFIYSQFFTEEENCGQEDLDNQEQLNDSDKKAAEKLVQIVEDEDSSATDIEQSQD